MASDKTGAGSESLQKPESHELRMLREVYESLSAQWPFGLNPETFPHGLNHIRFKVNVAGAGSIEVELSGESGARASEGRDFFSTEAVERYLASATLRVTIDFRADGEGTLTYGGVSVPCLGKPGRAYPKDQIVENIEGVQYQGDYGQAYKFRKWVSTEFDDPPGTPAVMLWSVKIDGGSGIFIHQGADTLETNGGPSQGCIHLASPNAEAFYNWITARTRITISYPW